MTGEEAYKKLLEYSSILNNCCCFVDRCVQTNECHFDSENNVEECENYSVFKTAKEALVRREE